MTLCHVLHSNVHCLKANSGIQPAVVPKRALRIDRERGAAAKKPAAMLSGFRRGANAN
jgi:hypothetical protein